MSLLHRVQALNHSAPHRVYYRFVVNGVAVGYIDTQLLADLDAPLFAVNHDKKQVVCGFKHTQKAQFERDIEAFFKRYFARKNYGGWRNEYYPVCTHYNSEPLFLTERATLSYLGVTGYGVHINGYVKRPDGIYMWIAKRSLNKPTAPGKLDQIVAGGLPYDLSPMENVIKECEEEASIPAAIAALAMPVSCLSYAYDLAIGLRPDVMFNYDLPLPEDFVPTVNDNEVESFALRPIDDVLTQIADSEDFKLNSAVTIIDFAIRHGIISPETPDYVALCQGMQLGKTRLPT